MLDHTDREILKLLKKNSRLQWREIGDIVHLSGPAVANRVQRLEKAGIIKKFTLQTESGKMGLPLRVYITVFMKSANHQDFLGFIRNEPSIERADRISGHGCYLLTVQTEDEETLNHLLDGILTHGNYQVNVSIGMVKE